jgi:hypothetical protein
LCVEVGVAEITSTNHGSGVVGDPQLVVHASVQAGAVRHEIEQPCDRKRAATQEGIEHPDLHVRMRGQRGEIGIAACRVQVVDQQPHAHAALRRAHRPVEQKRGRGVARDAVVLKVERALRRLRERRPGKKCFLP